MGERGITDPFPKGCLGSERCRIPAILTTPRGTLVAASDARWAHGQDTAGNLETMVARSTDNGLTWERQFVHHFEDVVDGSQRCIYSAGFIDPVLGCDREGTLYLLADMTPAYVGTFAYDGIVCGRESGRHSNGKLALKAGQDISRGENVELNEDTYPYYVGEADGNGYAPVLGIRDHESYEGYLVDEQMYLYRQGTDGVEKVMIPQLDGEGRPTDHMVHGNVFFAAAPLKVYPTFHIVCSISRDDGRTWSAFRSISSQFSQGGFVGVCPGRGISYVPEGADGLEAAGPERMIFPIYDNCRGVEYASAIYTEDQGKTWKRSSYADQTGFRQSGEIIKSSESQVVELPGGILRMYSRNQVDRIGYTESLDGGETWGPYYMEEQLPYCGNCMVSVIRYSRRIDGKVVLVASYPGGDGELYHRVNGIIAVGFYDETEGKVDWRHHYQVNQAPYYYSCLTEFADGRIGLLYEYEEYAMRLEVYEMEEIMEA